VRRLIAALVAVLLLAGGCIAPRARWASPTSGHLGPPSASASATSLHWTPCPDAWKGTFDTAPKNITYDCATLKVPQDWAHPVDGKTFDIAIVRGRNAGQRDKIGSLLINPGGPGGSGWDYGVYRAAMLPAEVTRRFDIIGFDPRGVGRSTPVHCFSTADLDTSFGADPDPVTNEQFATAVATAKHEADACGAAYGDTLKYFSTEQTARDMDAIRAALGDKQMTYLGYSYGTLLGAVYAELFPKNVRALVLDGAVDPTQSSEASAESQAKGFERAFDNFATWCKANASVCPIAPDARAAVVAAIQQGRTAPVKDKAGRVATSGWVFTAVAAALYSKSAWPALGIAINQLAGGRTDTLFALADSYADRDANGHYSNLFDANATIDCADDPHPPTVAHVRDLQTAWRAKYPLFGASMALNLICAQWPGGHDPYPIGPATGSAPILVVGTTGDPATPYEQTAALAKMLGVATVLTHQGEGHTAYPQTNCVTDAVNRYLIDLKVPPAGTICN